MRVCKNFKRNLKMTNILSVSYSDEYLLNGLLQPQSGSVCKRKEGGVTWVNMKLIKMSIFGNERIVFVKYLS